MRSEAPVVMSVRGVSKRFHMVVPGQEMKTTLLHPLRAWRASRRNRDLWAVRDVSFDVGQGEFFSIIGANGSGKSSLLRLLAGLSKPTAGTVETTGRLSTLLELGSGFHPQVSGRENAILNGLLIGMTRAEMEALLPSIVEFAGLQEFIDQPMRTYSSGMYVRLGFAIAAFMEPEILLVDEVLAVGDARFQEKCYDHIATLQRKGVTIIMVSHDLSAVERFSDRAALMERGRMVLIGTPQQVVTRHLERLAEIPEQPFAGTQSGFAGRDRLGSTAALLLEVWHARGLRVDTSVFDAEAVHRQAWSGVERVNVLNVPSGEAALELERDAASPADLILVDPYDCFDHWGAWLPALKRAARHSTVLVYLYNKAPRGTGYSDQYRRLRGALERWSADGPLLLGRLAADAVEPRAYHEVLLAGPWARDATLAGALRSDSVALARLLGHEGAFEALGITNYNH